MPFLLRLRWLEHFYAIFLAFIFLNIHGVHAPLIIKGALLLSFIILYILFNKFQIDKKIIYYITMLVGPLVIGSIITHLGGRPFIKTLGGICFLILIIFSAFAIKKFKFSTSLIILFSKYQSLLLSFQIVLYWLKVPLFYNFERGTTRLGNFLGDPNFIATNTALTCFFIALFLKKKSYENKILYIISILAILSTGSASNIAYLIFASLIIFFPSLINLSKKFFQFSFTFITNFLNIKFKTFLLTLLTIFFLILFFLLFKKLYSLEALGRPYKVIEYILSNNERLFEFEFLNKLSSGRYELAQIGLNLYSNFPFLNKIFGSGVTEYLSESRYIHNTYIEALLEGGIVLFTIFFILNIYFYISILKTDEISKMAKVFGITSNLSFLSLTLFYKILPIWALILTPIILNNKKLNNINRNEFLRQ